MRIAKQIAFEPMKEFAKKNANSIFLNDVIFGCSCQITIKSGWIFYCRKKSTIAMMPFETVTVENNVKKKGTSE